MSSQPRPVSEMNSSPWVQQAKDHWKIFRPKMYKELQEKGLLHQAAVEAAEQTQNDMEDAILNHGVERQSAWEDVRERYLFLPSEEDQPVLGENPDSASLEIEPGTH